MGSKKNVFVMGLDEKNLAALHTIRNAERYAFHPLLDIKDVVHVENYPLNDMLDRCRRILDDFGDRIDAIIGHWDFPVTSMVPILCREYGLRSPSLESVLKCGHKYWSRLEQQKAVPEHTPRFQKVCPFDEDALSKMELDFPFWVKPVKSFASALGFHVAGPEDFEHAMAEMRQKIKKIGAPFDIILGHCDLPPEVASVGGSYCIAEELIGGHELAPEGWVQNGEVHVHGVVDLELGGPHGRSIEQLRLPSLMPAGVQERAIEATKKVIRQVGLDDGCFNVEFFWDDERDKLWIVEINPRISQSHTYMFEKVCGQSNHEAAVSVALGERPELSSEMGEFEIAAKFWLRDYEHDESARVLRIPHEEDVARLRERFPEARVVPTVHEGATLGELRDQDAYSWLLAEIKLAAHDREELEQKYREALRMLPFDIAA